MQDCRNHRKRATKVASFTFLHSTWYKLANTIFAVLVSAYHGGRVNQTRTLYAIVGIAPPAEFWMGRPFPSPATKKGTFGDDCWVMLQGE